MSREIDERVVQMKFESGQFEKNVQTSIHSLDELKKGLDFKDAVKGFEKIDGASKSVKLDPLTAAVAQLNSHFNLLGITAFNVMNRISNKAIDTGEALVKSLSVDQISVGWGKYAEKTGSVQTIMAATAKQFSDTGQQMQYVNAQLDKLNWFTDETSYNFTDMVNNIGKFTSNNIALDKSVTAMQGIANWAAISGANANEASRAMYNLSQAMASGSLRLQDWMSIENANMGTAAFKEMAIQAALTAGTLVKVGDTVMTTDKKMQVSVESFRETLSKKWLTGDVLMATLNEYGAATNELNRIYEEYGILTSDIVSGIDNFTSGAKTAAEVAEDWGLTVEETTPILEKFQDETMQFGLKAFKAAQEAKTFEDAINSVKDAVSTGWMKSFEYIFGDYNEAKEFWTTIANSLYDIFAVGGEARNEMLKDWKAQGGQKYFTDAIYAGLAAIVRILTPIKAAWESVFGKMSSNQLLDLTKRLRDFLLRLSASQKTMNQIARVARGLFSILDMGKTIITQIAKGALETLEVVLNELGIDFGEVVAGAGDFLYILSRWMRQTNVITNAFKLLQDVLVKGIRSAKELIRALQDWGPVQKAISAFQKIFTSDFKGMGGIAEAFGNVMSWLWEHLKSFQFPSSLAEVSAFFSEFGRVISDSLENAGIDLSGFTDGLKNFGDFIKRTIGQINADFTTFAGVVKTAFGVIRAVIGSVDWAGVLLAAFGVTTLAILWRFTDALNTFAGALKNVTNVGAKVGGAFDAIKSYFNALKKNIEINNLLKTAIAVTALAVAFGLLAQLKWDQVKNASVAMVVITAALLGISAAFDKITKVKGKSDGQGIFKMIGFISSIAIAITLISFSLNNLKIDETLDKKVETFVKILAAVTAAALGFSWMSKGLQASAAQLLAIAVSVSLMVNTMKRLSQEDTGAIIAATIPIAALMGVIVSLSRLMNIITKEEVFNGKGGKNVIKKGGAFLNIIGIVVGIQLMISAVKRMSKLDPSQAMTGIVLMIPIVLALRTLMKAAEKAGRNAASGGKMLLAMAAAANLLYLAIKNFAKMEIGELAKGGVVVGILMTLMGAISTLFARIAGNKGQYASKAGLMMMQFAGALAVIQLVVKTLGKMDPVELAKGTAAVSALILAMGAAIRGVSKFKADLNGLKALTKIMIMIGIMSGVVIALTALDPTGAFLAGTGLAAVFASLALVINMVNKTGEKADLKPLLTISGVVAVMGIVIGALIALTKDWKTALAVTGGLALLIASIGVMDRLVAKSTGGVTEKKWQPMAKLIAVMAGVVGAFALLIALVGKENIDAQSIGALTVCMSGIMIAFGLMSGIMGSMKGKPDDKNINALVKLINSMALVIGAFAAVAGIANALGGSVSEVIYMTTGMAEIMLALGVMARAMNGVTVPDNLGDIQMLTAVVAAVTAIMAIIAGYANEHGADLSQVLTLATSMSVLLIALGAAVKLMDKAEFKMGAGQALILVGVVGALGLFLGAFSGWVDNPSNLVPLAAAMSVLLIGVSVAAKILSMFPNGGLSGAIQGGVVVLAIIGVMGAILVALGALDEYIGGGGKISSWLENGAQMMIDIGRGIGGFVGGIVGGLAEGLTSGFPGAAESISAGMVALQPFFDTLEGMPADILDKVQTLFDVVHKMIDPQFKAGLQGLKWVADQMTGGSESLQAIFSEFGLAIAAFGQSLGDINAEQVKTAVDAACELAKLEAGLPSRGGLFSTILGEDDLESFGGRLQALGSALWQFGVYGKLIDLQAVNNGITAATKLKDLEAGLPAKDGLLQQFFGQDDFSKFGERLRTFGSALVAFSNTCLGSEYGGGIDLHAVETGVKAGTMLKDLEKGLPSTGGVFGELFFGKKDLGSFGERLSTFGTALSGFSKAVSGDNAIDMYAVSNAVIATGKLSELEKTLDTSGGWNSFWNGDSTFKQFGVNLQQLGIGIKSFASNINGVNWANVTTAIAFIRDLTAVEKLEEAASTTLRLTKQLMTNVIQVIEAQEVPMRAKGADMAKWVVEGFAKGINDYSNIALTAAKNLVSSIIAIMNLRFKIHSPSVVMNEMGHWVVKGLGEGITEEMSAEEAAEQKAQNIISAFQNALSKMDLKLNVSNLEYEVWTKTEGKGLQENDPLLMQKKLENEVSKLEAAAQKAGMLQTAMAAVLETAGEESQAYLNARQNYLEALSAMYDQQATVDELQGTNLKNQNQSWADQTKLFAQLQAENAEAFKMMGKSEEELRDWAAKQVGDSFARSLETNDLMQEYKETFDRLGYSQEERLEKVNEMLGPETITKMEKTIVDTNAIIDNALKEQKYDLEEIIAENVASAVRGAGGGSGGAAIDAASMDLGRTIEDSLSAAFEQIEIPEIEGLGLENLDEALGEWGDPSKWFEKAQSLFSGDDGFLGGMKSSTKGLVEGTKGVIGEVVSYVTGDEVKDTVTDAAHTVTEAYSTGLEDEESKGYAKTGAEAFANTTIDTLNDSFKSANGDGTIGTDAANQVATDFVEETNRQAPLIKTTVANAGAGAVNEVTTTANKATTAVANTVPQYKEMGKQMMVGLQKGIKENAYLALNEAQTQANKVAEIMAAAVQVASPSKVTQRIGKFISMGLAIGIRNGTPDVQDASESLANTTVDTLTQAKTLISNVLDSDDDFSPTITPVLDLDQLTADSKQIPGLLSRNTRLNVSATARRANALNQSFDSSRQNGSDGSIVTNYNMTQNNYSPKALNRSEIYRQTNNQFSQLKGATRVR